MLSWFRKMKARDDAFQDLMGTAKKIAWLRAAIISLGVRATEEGDSFASEGALALLSAVTKRTMVRANRENTDFVDGIMLLVFCGQFSRFLEMSFEFSSSLALMSYFGSGKSDNVAQAINSYNQMTIANNNSIEAIGNLCVKWCWKPDEESLNELAELRGVLLIHAES